MVTVAVENTPKLTPSSGNRDLLDGLSVATNQLAATEFVRRLGKTFVPRTVQLDSGGEALVWYRTPQPERNIPGIMWTALETVQGLASQAALRVGASSEVASSFGTSVAAFTILGDASRLGIPAGHGRIIVLPVPPDGVTAPRSEDARELRDLFRRMIRHENAHAQSGDGNEVSAVRHELRGDERSHLVSDRVTKYLDGQRSHALPEQLRGLIAPIRVDRPGVQPTQVLYRNAGAASPSQMLSLSQGDYRAALERASQVQATHAAWEREVERLNALRRAKLDKPRSLWDGLLAIFGIEGEEIGEVKGRAAGLAAQKDREWKLYASDLKNAITRVRQSHQSYDAPRPSWFDRESWELAKQLTASR